MYIKLFFLLFLIFIGSVNSLGMILNKSVGSRFLAQALDSTALQKNTRLTYG